MIFLLTWNLLVAFAPELCRGAKNFHRDTFVEGSGTEELLEECQDSFISYADYFLKGVKEEFFVTYNQTTEQECMKYCCLEKHFECSSFSYFPALSVCFVMNLTMHDDVAYLRPFKGIIHYDKALPTDPAAASAEIVTNNVDPNQFIVLNDDDSSESNVEPTEYVAATPTPAQESCPVLCENGGTCVKRNKKLDGKRNTNVTTWHWSCICKNSHHGMYCEKEIKNLEDSDRSITKGVPTYVIVLAVFGFLIVLLLITALAVYVIYRKRTGKYRVKQQRERWNKRTRKDQARRSRSNPPTQGGPAIASAFNVPGSINSSGTISTALSV